MKIFPVLFSFSLLFAGINENQILDPSFNFIFDSTNIIIGEDSVGSFTGVIYNNSSDIIIINVVRRINDLPDGWTSSICIGSVCYNETVDSVANELLGGDSTVCGVLVWSNGVGSGEVQIDLFDLYYPNENIVVDLYFSTETTVIVDDNNLISADIRIISNYPNPFNPVTRLNYKLIKNNFVNLTIYDVKGYHVKTLINKKQPAGVYSIIWDGTNNIGQEVVGGVYFFCIQSDQYIHSGKMLFIK